MKTVLRLVLFAAIFSISPYLCFSQGTAPANAAEAAETGKSLSQEELEYQKRQAIIDQNALQKAEQIKGRLKGVVGEVQKYSPQTADFLAKKYFGVMFIQYVASVFMLLATFVATKYFLRFLFARLDRMFRNSGSKSFAVAFLENLRKPLNLFAWALGVYVALVFILEDSGYVTLVSRVMGVFFWIALFWGVWIVCDSAFAAMECKFRSKSSAATVNLADFLRRVLKFFIVVVAFLSVLTSCGVNVNTIIASLGIGGMALAFASQDTIANFFGSVSIILDRPFMVGDWVKTSSCEGTVEAIGFRSTRIRTFSKTLVTIPNSSLAKEAVENFTKMPARKVMQTVGLTYSATPDQIESAMKNIREAISKSEGVDTEGGVYVEFAEFGASSLDLSVIYYVKHIDAANFAATKRRANLAIMRAVADMGLSFAFPSTSVYIESMPDKKHS